MSDPTLRLFETDSPLGRLRGAVTPAGLALLALPASDFETPLARLARDARVLRSHDDLSRRAVRELRACFAGSAAGFTVPLDLGLVGPFAQRVLRELVAVPWGGLVTYGELAERIGRPGAARAVGGAVGSNPLPIVIPCHRVVASDGRLGGFSGGLDVKRRLLELEGHAVDGPASGRWSRARVRAAAGVSAA
mgnify:CR=1 FL=1